MDNTQEMQTFQENAASILITEETDRIYLDAANTCMVRMSKLLFH